MIPQYIQLNESTESLGETIDAAFNLVSYFGASIFDFHDVEVTIENLEQSCCLLRALTTWKTHVKGYNEGIQKCLHICVEHDIDAQDILYGML